MLICSSTCNNTLNMSDMVISLDWLASPWSVLSILQTFSTWWSADKWQDFSKSESDSHAPAHFFLSISIKLLVLVLVALYRCLTRNMTCCECHFLAFLFKLLTLFLFIPLLSSTDHAANWSRGGEQSAYQLWWRSHLPEVQTEFLHPQLALPPWAGGLDSGLQPWPKG